MAQNLDPNDPFLSHLELHRGERISPAEHPWIDWLDGQVWQLTPGQDFHHPIDRFRQHVYYIAKTHDLRVRTIVRDGTLIIRATPRPQPG